MQAGVFGLIDNTHAAAAQLLDNAVVGDGLTEQKGEALRPRTNMLGVRKGQVNGTREVLEHGYSLAPTLLEICEALPERDDVKFLARLAIPLQKLCGSEV